MPGKTGRRACQGKGDGKGAEMKEKRISAFVRAAEGSSACAFRFKNSLRMVVDS